MNYPKWYYNDLRQIGTDYEDISHVKSYEKEMKVDPARYRELITSLGILENDTLIDFGSGAGDFAIETARVCSKVYAVDVSQTALDYSREKAESYGVTNIEYHNGGFLTYEHAADPVDFIFSQTAFHHLPEFWKVAALVRMRDMLKDRGVLCIRDVIFSFDPLKYAEGIDGWIAREAKPVGQGIPPERFETHIRQEYSTFSWLIEEMLKRTGYEIVSAKYPMPEYAEFVCRKAGTREGTRD